MRGENDEKKGEVRGESNRRPVTGTELKQTTPSLFFSNDEEGSVTGER